MKKILLPLLLGSILLLSGPKVQANIFRKIANWFQDLTDKDHGSFNEPNSVGLAPLTTFDRNSDFNDQLVRIRALINSNDDYKFIYGQLYANASTNISGLDCSHITSDGCALVAKDAAFVYLIGLDNTGATLTSIVRTTFKAKAITLLLSADYSNKRMGGPIAIVENVDASYYKNLLQYRSKELIMFLQAYDMLNASNRVAGLSFEQNFREAIRDRLHEFTAEFYKKANNVSSALYLKNNHALMAGAALGMAAVVLHEVGHRIYKTNYHPERWINAANFSINKALWTADNPQSLINFEAGYAEGPYYFTYGFENLLPYFRTYLNFVPYALNKTYHRHIYNPGGEEVMNFLHDKKYDRLYEWYVKMLQPNGYAPSYDDSYVTSSFPGLAILRKQEYSVLTQERLRNTNLIWGGSAGYSLRADFLAALTPPREPEREPSFANKYSGDIVVRTPFGQPINNQHYIHINAGGESSNDGNAHEHKDVSSFIITAGEEILAMDPPYYAYEGRNDVNEGEHHNIITKYESGENKGPTKKDKAIIDYFHNTERITFVGLHSRYEQTDFSRQFVIVKEPIYYYVITDIVQPDGMNLTKVYNWNFNGNGNEDEATFAGLNGGKVGRYTHPCTDNRLWAVQTEVSVSGSSVSFNSFQGGEQIHGSFNSILTNPVTATYGEHTRMQATASGAPVFLSIIRPYLCSDNPPTVSQMRIMSDYTSQLLDSIGPEYVKNFHISRRDTSITDTIINPLEISGSSAIFETDGKHAMFSYAPKNVLKSRFCESHTHFRKALLLSGKTLKYHDTTFISATDYVMATYQIRGKFKYQGSAVVADGQGPTEVTFFLPDLEPNFPMKACIGETDEELDYSYVDSTHMMTVNFPEGITEFTFKLADPCRLSCFFPPTATTIDTIFDFNEGTRETLGHDLDIVQSEGWLKMTNGSKVDICPDVTLRNIDSITMVGLFPTMADSSLPFYTEYGEGGQPLNPNSGKVDNRLSTKRAMIIIRNEGALVLDNHSYTHIGANSTILVKRGGTLLIRSGATVEIGDEGAPGYGEIIAEDGSYVCVEEGADVHFFNHPTDSSDKHLFFIPTLTTTPAVAGTNSLGAAGKFLIDSIFYDTECLPFCDIKTYNGPYGVNNRIFGWANFNFPVSSFDIQDTFCFGDEIYLDGIKTLNETKYRYEVCNYDTANDECFIGSQEFFPPLTGGGGYTWDSVRISKIIFDEYDFAENKHYQIKQVVINDCHEEDDTSQLIFISPLPLATFTFSDNPACPGFETFSCDGSGSTSGIHRWSVSLIYDYQYMENDTNAIQYTMDWNEDGTVSSNFDFPGFNFIGGYNYKIELKVFGFCGYKKYVDTLHVPLSATVEADDLTIYMDSVGSSSTHLHGIVTGATSWNWSPTTGLSSTSSLNPIVYITSTTSYILTATDGTCTDKDTVTIKVNYFANAGEDKYKCGNSTVSIGTSNPNMPISYTYSWSPDLDLEVADRAQPDCFTSVTTTYTLYILDSHGDTVEFNEMTVYVDTFITPNFQMNLENEDSSHTICFVNYSEPIYTNTEYYWDFGDGNTSILVNPCHKYPDFGVDTFYVACLTATNTCDDSTVCDTVWVFTEGLDVPDTLQSSPIPMVIDQRNQQDTKLLGCAPNPTKERLTFYYSVFQFSSKPEILISTATGKLVNKLELDPNSKTCNFDCTHLSPGIYFYSLIENDRTIETKRFIITK